MTSRTPLTEEERAIAYENASVFLEVHNRSFTSGCRCGSCFNRRLILELRDENAALRREGELSGNLARMNLSLLEAAQAENVGLRKALHPEPTCVHGFPIEETDCWWCIGQPQLEEAQAEVSRLREALKSIGGYSEATRIRGRMALARETLAADPTDSAAWLAAHDAEVRKTTLCPECGGAGSFENITDIDGRQIRAGGECRTCGGYGVVGLSQLVAKAVQPWKECYEEMALQYHVQHGRLNDYDTCINMLCREARALLSTGPGTAEGDTR